MGLRHGWRNVAEAYKTIWSEDSALGTIPQAILAQWREKPDASLLLPFAKPGETPEVFTYRTLTADELAHCRNAVQASDGFKGSRAYLRAFRIVVRFPNGPKSIKEDTGVVHDDLVEMDDSGIMMLAEEFTNNLIYRYPNMADFYGSRVMAWSRMSDAEKKASLPPSTPTPSPEASPAPTESDSTTVNTAASAGPGGAAA